MTAPTNCKHKPIIEISNYENKDVDFYNKNKAFFRTGSDAKSLSIGTSQFEKGTEISAKVWRKTGKGSWNPRSEELPIHRVLDLAAFIIGNLKSTSEGATIVSTNELDKIKEFYQDNKGEFDTRIKDLQKAIDNFKSTP